ncbi:hypothetical protein JKY79_02800 [Candidatus Babeliales bacterium]|nr:hypothetical protein [Candidatus Babeliales bacterium]
MKSLRYSIFIILSIILIPTHLLVGLGMPAVAFKDVGACFKPKFEMYAPMFGSMALSSGFIENLRLYNVIPGSKDKDGRRMYVKDRALDNDPIMEIALILFPSPAGQLTTEGAGLTNVGNYFEEEDVAQLFNVVYGVRGWLSVDKKSEEGSSKKKKGAQKKKQPLTEFSILLEERGLGNHLKKMDINIDTFIEKITEKSSEKRFKKNLKKNLESLFVNIVKALEQETNIHKKVSESLSKEEEKEEEGIDEKEEKVVAALDASFHPNHMVEQVIGAFFCHKFSRQENISNLLLTLHEDIVDKEKIANIDRLLNENDLFPARERIRNGEGSIDDIWISLHKDYFNIQVLPYKNNQSPISNGNAEMYSRSLDEKEKNANRRNFADCVEVTMRHMMNFILFDSKEKEFSLNKLDDFMTNKDRTYIRNLKDFYDYQKAPFANSGDLQVRSLWNRVVADLGGNITYLQKFNAEENNNEVESGILNFVRVFERIFDFDLGDEPKFIQGQEDNFIETVQDRFSDCFKILFEEISPKSVAVQIHFSNVKIFSIHGEDDLSGDISISINDKDSNEKLFSFVIYIRGYHIEIHTLKINQNKSATFGSVETEQIVGKLNELSMSEGNASFFLADELIEHYGMKSNPMYQIFCKSLNDTNGKLQALTSCHDLFNQIDEKQMSLIIKNIMNNYLWNDMNSVRNISKKIFDEWQNQRFIRIITEYVEKISLNSSNIETINLLEFPVLKEISLCSCKNLKFIGGASESLELLKIAYSSIQNLDLSGCPKLKVIDLRVCKNIQSPKGLPASLKALHLVASNIEIINISEFPGLKEIHLSYCNNLKFIEGASENLELVEIAFSNIENIDLSKYPNLKTLDIDECRNILSLKGLPASLESLRLVRLNIETLSLSECQNLKTFEITYCKNIKSMNQLPKNIESIKINDLDIETFDLSNLPSHKKVEIIQCDNLQSFDKSSEGIEELQFFYLENIKSINLLRLPALKELRIDTCRNLKSIIISESFPDELRQDLENKFPEKVTIEEDYLHLQDATSVPCTIL